MTEPLKNVQIGIDAGAGVSWTGFSPALAEHLMHARLPSYAGRPHTVHLRANNLEMQIKVNNAGEEVEWAIRCITAAATLKALTLLQHAMVPHAYSYDTEGKGESVTFYSNGELPEGFVSRLTGATQ